MLRIIQNVSAAGAKSYYSTADYYTEGQELAGQWRGKGAARLGLVGEVDRASWEALCDNRDPQTGVPLTLRTKDNRTIGYDFNFHVPKSVSVLYGLTKDERILEAFREAVGETMRDMESEMQTRVRKGGRQEDRTVGNMAWGEFIHFTSRPVDGVPDPHLHAHCFVFNTVWDDKEQAWKAGQFRNLKRDAPYFQAVFHSRLAGRLADTGYGIERKAKGWEIAGVRENVLDKFSRRTELIERMAEEEGITDAAEKDKLGAKTRERKAKNLTAAELLAEWRSRLTGDEWSALSGVREEARPIERIRDERSAEEGMRYAIGHCFVRKSVVPERELLAEAINHSVGQATPEEVNRQLSPCGVITGTLRGRRMAFTREILGEEEFISGFAREGRGTLRATGVPNGLQRGELNDGQWNLVLGLLRSRDRINLVDAGAGVGKTTAIKTFDRGMRLAGENVTYLGTTTGAVEELRKEGLKADTLAAFLLSEKMQEAAKGGRVVVDEVSMLGHEDAFRLFSVAQSKNLRIDLVGDSMQHGSVPRGNLMIMLQKQGGLKPFRLEEIMRQKDNPDYLAAVKLLAKGKTLLGFDKLDAKGWIREVPAAERYKLLASGYVAAVEAGQTAIVVSPTHVEKNRITREIRATLKHDNRISTDERVFLALENANLTEAQRTDAVNYVPGDVLQFHQNAKRGYKKGQRIEVSGAEPLPLDLAERFQVYHSGTITLAPGDVVRITQNGFTADGEHALKNGDLRRIRGFDANGNIVLSNGWTIARDFGHLDYGYVVTSHASQGKTVDRVFIGQSADSFPASSREQFYVSCSRGRHGVMVFTDDKEALREAVSHSDERISAMDLFSADRWASARTLHRRHEQDLELVLAAKAARDAQSREGLTYER
jgi:conjugative relaxase-like TrwC/TraI family protein